MILAYPARLLCACLAAFFLVHVALGLLVSLLTPAVLRRARQIDAQRAARRLLALRLAPLAGTLFVVLGLCVPSYLRLETETGMERVGFGCLMAASLAAATWAISLTRGARAYVRSVRHARAWARASRPGTMGVRLVDAGYGVLALTGIFRSRIFVSRQVFDLLTAEEIAAALRHETAHRISRDNLKRLFLMLAPGLVPFRRGFGGIERAWVRYAEWAADDMAAAGDSRRSLALATALVRVARMPVASPVISLFDGGADLAERVERLLRVEPPARSRPPYLVVLAAGAVAAVAAAVLPDPGTLVTVHRLLEHLIR